MISLKRSVASQSAETILTEKVEAEEYPYGLCLYLDEEVIQKLGLTIPEVGESIQLKAVAKVKSYSESNDGEGVQRSLSLQITDLGTNAETNKDDRVKRMYMQDEASS